MHRTALIAAKRRGYTEIERMLKQAGAEEPAWDVILHH